MVVARQKGLPLCDRSQSPGREGYQVGREARQVGCLGGVQGLQLLTVPMTVLHKAPFLGSLHCT